MKRLILILALSISAHGQILQGIIAGGSGTPAPTATTARSFNGTTQYMQNTTTYLSAATAFTIAFWFKSGDVTQTNRYFMALQSSGNPAVLYGFANDGSGHAQLEMFVIGGTGDFRTGSQITIADTNWHHVAWTYAGTGGEYARWLDGTKTVINATATLAFQTFTADFLTIGAGTSTFVNSSVARVLISTVGLAAKIPTLAGSTCSSSGATGVIGYWQILGVASPEPESSPSPNTNSLTLNGAPPQVTGPICSGS